MNPLCSVPGCAAPRLSSTSRSGNSYFLPRCKEHWSHNFAARCQPRWQDSGGYWWLRREDGSLIREHRAVMEGLLGRPLAPREQVYHRDGNRSNNSLASTDVVYELRAKEPG